MGILDPRMMYRAGFARGHKGRNTEVEARLARQERLVNFAYEVVGNVAVDAIQDGFQSLQKFRDQLESQSSAGLTKVEKLPRENTALRQSIIDISNNSLTQIDVSNCLNLETFRNRNSLISSLDLSNNDMEATFSQSQNL